VAFLGDVIRHVEAHDKDALASPRPDRPDPEGPAGWKMPEPEEERL